MLRKFDASVLENKSVLVDVQALNFSATMFQQFLGECALSRRNIEHAQSLTALAKQIEATHHRRIKIVNSQCARRDHVLSNSQKNGPIARQSTRPSDKARMASAGAQTMGSS